MALAVADHGYVMENGRIVLEGPAAKLRDNSDIKEFYLGLNEGGARKSYRDTKHYKRRKRWLSWGRAHWSCGRRGALRWRHARGVLLQSSSPCRRRADAARPAVRGVRRSPVPQAQPVDRSHHGARLPAAGARTGRGQGGIAGRQRGADAARQATFRQGPPFETHFVCLLDAQRRPLFFYALPALATRGAPTPVTRGGTPAPAPPTADTPTLPLGQAPLSAPEPARPALPASAVRLRGLVRDLGGRLQLCRAMGRRSPWRTARRSRNSPASCAS